MYNVWCKLFERKSIPYDVDFFQLGGYSLLLYKCQTELEKAFAMEFPMKELLQNTTVRKLAEYIALKKNNQQKSVGVSYQDQPKSRIKKRRRV